MDAQTGGGVLVDRETGAVVLVLHETAASPLRWDGGFLKDANGALVVRSV